MALPGKTYKDTSWKLYLRYHVRTPLLPDLKLAVFAHIKLKKNTIFMSPDIYIHVIPWAFP